MRHVDLVNAVEALVEATCADSVKDALAAVCARRVSAEDGEQWIALALKLDVIPNLGV